MDDDTPAVATAAAAASSASASGASAGVSSSSASGPGRSFVVNFPPGYHFLPTDAELVLHYLRPRLANHQQLPLPIFFDERILHYHPDRLIEKYREYGEDRWFFFTKRERKHEGGNRPNRATPDNGHWNATGSPRRIRSGRALVGRVRTLVFYEAAPRRKKKSHDGLLMPPVEEEEEEEGRANKGVKTEWTMYEYESLASEEEFVATCADGNAKMDVIVLCTIQKKQQKEKQGEEGKETRVKTKTRERGLDVLEQDSCAGGKKTGKKRKRTEEAPEDEDITLTETEEREHELAVAAITGVPNFTVGPNANMSHRLFSNTSSSPPQETMTASGDNIDISVCPSTAAMERSQFQAGPLIAQEFLPVPYLHQKILAPPLGGGNNYRSIMAPMWMDQHFASDRQTAPPPPLEEPSTGTTAKTVAAWARQLYGFAPGLSNGFTGDGHRLSAGISYLDLSRFPQSSAASMAASDEWWRPLSTQGSSGQS